MKLLVLNYEYPPIGGGGGRACADLCKALAARGYEIRVLTTWAPGLNKREMVDGYEVNRVWAGRRSRFKATFWDMAGYIFFGFVPGLRAIRRWQPALMHVHFGVPTGALALLLHLFTGMKYVLTGHLGDIPGGVPEKTDLWFKLVDPFTPPIWNQASKVIAVSNHTKSLIDSRYGIEVGVIPNGLEIRQGTAKSVNDPPRLIFAGRFQPQKNLLFLFEALAQIAGLSWTLTMVGDGPLRTNLEQLASDLELMDRIHFTGWVDSDQVEAYLDNSDVLVMPSRSEGLPVVAVQALAHGLAMAVTQAGGLADLVDDSYNGFKTPVGASGAYVEELKGLLSSPETIRRMKKNSLKKAEQFSLVTVASAYEEVFHQAKQ